RVNRYETLSLDRPGAPMQIGVLDLEGTLYVTDPSAFLGALGAGFGRAKAFGCGLMLIRRA
ncbi:MAG: type I-E CRISPR-associated protein Cas6/Cse3/CasE, partial [Gemmatimonadota bacterium]|nr:type I-E CRISPR-associated protein Cas6/Cse3/CasE [Gemmatimonadota bacterium]